jgi:hypothetical protein
MTERPTRADFETAIEKASRRQIINSNKTLICWAARIYNAAGEQIGFGLGDNAGEAMAFAWLAFNDPDILTDGITPDWHNWLEEDQYTVHPEYRFATFPPGTGDWWFDPDDPDDGGPDSPDRPNVPPDPNEKIKLHVRDNKTHFADA